MRIKWIDKYRGLLMVLMALDHANYFIRKIHIGEFWGLSLPQYSNALCFLSRFVTHICAPGFFFIMGISIILFADSRYRIGWSRIQVFKHYAIRGVILIILQLFIEDPAWMIGNLGNVVQMNHSPGGGGEVWFHFGVLSALGCAMIVCGLLLFFRPYVLILFSFIAIAITAAIIPALDADTHYSFVLRLLFIPGQTDSMQVFYPLFPWVGLTAGGMAFGKRLLKGESNLVFSLIVGLLLIVIFAILRATSLGSFHNPLNGDWIAFLNVTKYPPSLTFIALTMGVNLCLFALFIGLEDRIKSGIDNLLQVFGKTALFFYLIHLYLYACIGFMFPCGTNIFVMYAVWIVGLGVLYPVCKWYAFFKKKSAPNSFWRFI